MTLTGAQIARIQTAILPSYDRDELRQMILACMNEDFSHHVSPEGRFSAQVFEFVEWANRKGRALELLRCAAEGNERNVGLQTLWAEAQTWDAEPPPSPPTSPAVPHHVFLAYSRKDDAVMRRLRADLLVAGIVAWVDQEDLEPGTPVWQRAIETAIRAAKCIVVILTPDAKKSEWVNIEISLAHRLGLEIIPVLARGDEDSAVLFALEARHRIDLRMDFTGAVKRQLIPLIRKHLETVQSVSTPRLVDEPVARLHKAPIDIEWIVIPKGEFLMGSEKESDRHAYDDEMPQHPLYLDEYIIAKYPVTNSQYQIFVHATNYQPPAHWRYGLVPGAQENHPVTNISWFDAIAFCNWLSRMLESTIRLPTEAEWEKAARGTDGRIWPWGNVPPTKDHCNYGSFFGSTTPVERYSKILGPYGAIGMAGNVWEWTMSLFMGYPYQLDDGRDDIGNDGQRTLRGGSWISNDALVRCACRDGGDPKVGDITTGFRIMCFCR